MKKLIIAILSLLITFVTMSPCFCDDIVYVDPPNLKDIVNEFEYTGNDIVFEVPESEYYTVGGNIQTEVGEYDAIVYLNRQGYVWRNGSRDDLFYHFSIRKSDYDLSDVVFKDKAYIADGNSYSLQATNLPEGMNVEYSSKNISEPGNYLIVAMLTGDGNHNQVDPLTATLYLLEKPSEEVTLGISLGSVSGYLPQQTELNLKSLNKSGNEYKKIHDILVENKVDENTILDVYGVNYSYNNVEIESHESVTYNIDSFKEEKVNVYTINLDENGNSICKKAKYKIKDDVISFETDISSYLVFVKGSTNYFLYIGIGIGIVALVSLIVMFVVKRKKNNNGSKDNKKTKAKTIKKANRSSMYKRAEDK